MQATKDERYKMIVTFQDGVMIYFSFLFFIVLIEKTDGLLVSENYKEIQSIYTQQDRPQQPACRNNNDVYIIVFVYRIIDYFQRVKIYTRTTGHLADRKSIARTQ